MLSGNEAARKQGEPLSTSQPDTHGWLQGHKRTGPEDGLDELLAGLEGLDSGVPGDVDANASAGSDSDVGGESDDLSDSDSQGGDGDSLTDEQLQDDGDSGDEGFSDLEGNEGEESTATAPKSASEPKLLAAPNGLGRASAHADTSARVAVRKHSVPADSDDASSGSSADDDSASADDSGSSEGDSADGNRHDAQKADAQASARQISDARLVQQRASSAGVHVHAAAAPRYVPPALRRGGAAQAAATSDRVEPNTAHQQELEGVRKHIRSLLNRVASTNLGAIAKQLADTFAEVPRHLVIDAIVASTMQALAEGPRAVDQFAAVTASLVTLIAASAPAQDLLAKLLYAVAEDLERARREEDSIAASNLLRVVAYLFVCKAIGTPYPVGTFVRHCTCRGQLRGSAAACTA